MINNSEPLVSIIMSEFNTDVNLLLESIKSILNQTYVNIELILIDDCGKNDLKKIIDSFNDRRIIYIKNQCNKGLVYSLNKGLEVSKGKYVARMDTDDYSYKERIKTQVDFMEKNPKIDVIGANVDYYDGNDVWGKSKIEGVVTKKCIIKQVPLFHPTIMAKRDVLIRTGGYPDYKRCEDYALWIELFYKGYVLYNIEDVVLRYHLSLEDYSKRTLSTRKGFFKLIKTQYKKLQPTHYDIIRINFKTFLAGILPYKLMYYYHRHKVYQVRCK